MKKSGQVGWEQTQKEREEESKQLDDHIDSCVGVDDADTLVFFSFMSG